MQPFVYSENMAEIGIETTDKLILHLGNLLSSHMLETFPGV